MDADWLQKCNGDNMPIPPFERYIHMLPFHVVKRRLCPGELGYRGYKPDFYTLPLRDDNEISAIELVRQHTDIPVPKLIYRGNGFNVFERFQGVTVNERRIWDKVSYRQREAIMLQVRGYIRQLTKIPNPGGGLRSLIPCGELFHPQLPYRGPFKSTADFLGAYADCDVPLIHEIAHDSEPVFSHMDWDLSNVILYPNLDAVMGVIDWERACFFPEGGRAIHKMCHQWEGWEMLFDGLEFPKSF